VAPADFLRATIRFFARRTEYMGILKSMCSNARDIEELSRRECGKRGIRLEAPKTGGNKAAAVYVFTTVLFYVLQYREFGAASALSPDAFAESLAGFLCAGWPALREFSAEEKAFCDARCEIHPSEMTEEDRFFSALMAVALKYGILGITIERIAGELGMAKSSLYTFFESKETLIRGLIRKEVTALARLLSAKMAGVTSVSSAVYVYMHLIYRYLLLRPAIIPVIVWHFALGGAPNDLYNGLILDEPGEGLRLIAEGGGPGVGLNMPGESLALWLASLPVAAMIHLHRFFFGRRDAAARGSGDDNADSPADGIAAQWQGALLHRKGDGIDENAPIKG
jgi:AcrR family transcriptional regulator